MFYFYLNLKHLLVLSMGNITCINLFLFLMGSPARHKEAFAPVFFSWQLSEVSPCLIINYSS